MPASISLATTCHGALTMGTTTACSAGAIRELGPVGVPTSVGARSLALPSAHPTLPTARRVRTGCPASGLASPCVVSTVSWLLYPGLAICCVHCHLASMAWLGHEHRDLGPLLAVGKPSLCVEMNTNAFPCLSQLLSQAWQLCLQCECMCDWIFFMSEKFLLQDEPFSLFEICFA